MQVIGTITTTDGTSKNNSTTAVPFSLPSKFVIQPDVDVRVRQSTTSALGVAVQTDFKIPADAIVDIDLVPGNAILAMLPTSGAGTANLRVGLR